MVNFQINSNFKGYFTNFEKTNLDPRYLVFGSQNVLVDSFGKISTREGYILDGVAATDTNPNVSSYDWKTARGGERNLRGNGTVLEIRRINGTTITWETLLSGLTSGVKMQFTTWYSSTETEELLLFVMNNANIYEWSGGLTTFASVTATTITKQGTTTWAEEGFLQNGTRQFRVKLDNGTWSTVGYTGGEGTTTLTGLTVDLTSSVIAAGNLILQEVRVNSNQPAASLTNNFIATSRNQVYVGQNNRNLVYVSSNTSFTTYTFSSPRVPGEGAQLTLDAPIIGFKPLRDATIIFCGEDKAYKTEFDLKSTSTSFIEQLKVVPLKIGAKQGAMSQDLIESIGDVIVYLSNEPALRMLGDISDSGVVILKNLSDPIKPDFDDETFTNGHLKFYRNSLYLTTPTNGNLYILQFKETADGEKTSYWQPPQILPIRQLAIIGADLIGHSLGGNESFSLFNGTNDNDLPFKAKAVLAYRNFGKRFAEKEFNEWAIEGYIAANTKLIHRLNYEFDGSLQQLEKIIDGANDKIILQADIGASLGDQILGDMPIGGNLDTDTNFNKFRVINQFVKQRFYEIQEIFESNNVDMQWQIIGSGPSVELSRLHSTIIKQ